MHFALSPRGEAACGTDGQWLVIRDRTSTPDIALDASASPHLLAVLAEPSDPAVPEFTVEFEHRGSGRRCASHRYRDGNANSVCAVLTANHWKGPRLLHGVVSPDAGDRWCGGGQTCLG
jgi:hypothetical protein